MPSRIFRYIGYHKSLPLLSTIENSHSSRYEFDFQGLQNGRNCTFLFEFWKLMKLIQSKYIRLLYSRRGISISWCIFDPFLLVLTARIAQWFKQSSRRFLLLLHKAFLQYTNCCSESGRFLCPFRVCCLP